MKSFAQNKSAFRDYEITENYEAGIILRGFEVKAIRAGKMNLKGAYVSLKGQDITLVGAHIAPFQAANTPSDYDSYRPRILLLNNREKRKLISFVQPSKDAKAKSSQSSFTVIPLKVYNKRSLIKIELGLGKGLKKYDKREVIKKKESRRTMKQAREY